MPTRVDSSAVAMGGVFEIAAAAKDAGHGLDDFVLRWLWIALEQRRGLHDLARLTVAALRHLPFKPGQLQGMIAVCGKPLDGRDPLSAYLLDRGAARAHRPAIKMHGACATLSDAAGVLGAGQP